MPIYKHVLELLKRADLTTARANRLGISNLDNHIKKLRRKGYDIRCVKRKTYAYFGKKQ